MSKMTTVLNNAILEGHNEEMFNMLLAKIIDSNQYENFILSNISKSLMKLFMPLKFDEYQQDSS